MRHEDTAAEPPSDPVTDRTGGVEAVDRARRHTGVAIQEQATGRAASFADLVAAAEAVAAHLLGEDDDLAGARVAWLVPAGVDAAATLWGIWLAGGVAVPLALSHPRPELAHVVTDSGATTVVVAAAMADRVRGLADRVLHVEDLRRPPAETRPLPDVAPDAGALIIYTSGSTGRPKGALWTHEALAHQVRTMVAAWRWEPADVALLLLPLHHLHGLVNVLACALWTGATVVVADGVDPRRVWASMDATTVLMAVPTIYHRLLEAHDAEDPAWRARASDAAREVRLMVSGSAALPVSVLERWEAVTGHRLLERYGMTEIGMALTNPYDGPRRAGTVGQPFPGVEVRVVDEAFGDVADGEDGQLLVRSPGIFREYWGRPDATAEAFHDGWFLTGDVVVRQDGVFRIRGRMSVDIIKTGGFKVSALEVEEVLRTHPAVSDCAVVGLPDERWGEVIAAALVPAAGVDVVALGADALQPWLQERLAPYKVPRRVAVVSELPRNAMGKVVKPRVAAECLGAG